MVPNGSKWLQMSPNRSKGFRMGQKLSQCLQMGWKGSKLVQIGPHRSKGVQMGANWSKWVEMVPNGFKWVQMCTNDQSFLKVQPYGCAKIFRNCARYVFLDTKRTIYKNFTFLGSFLKIFGGVLPYFVRARLSDTHFGRAKKMTFRKSSMESYWSIWVQMGPNGSKWVQIGPNLSKCVQINQIGPNETKGLQMAQNGIQIDHKLL